MKIPYDFMLFHYDKLVQSGPSKSNGLEYIRDTYKRMYKDQNINYFDVYKTVFDIEGNSIGSMVTLVGPDDGSIYMDGVMPDGDRLGHVDIVSDDLFKSGIVLEKYMNTIFNSMRTIVSVDRMWSLSKHQPYREILAMIPFFYTFQHISNNFDEFDECIIVLKKLAEKYTALTPSEADIVFGNLDNSNVNFSYDVLSMYNDMTNGGEFRFIL